MFNPYSAVLLIEKEQPDEFKVRIAKSKAEIKASVDLTKGPLSWFLNNQGILINNDFNDSSTKLGYYENEENIKCFMASSIRFNETVVGIYRELGTNGIQIPQEALILYNGGLAKADESYSLYNCGSYKEASRIAVEALMKFKESWIS